MLKKIITFITAILIGTSVFAVDGTWTNLVGGSWSNVENWSGGIIASGASSTASFTNATGVTITNTYLALTNANFYFTNANYTITGGTNILDCPMTGTSTVTVAGTRTATITTKLHGTNTLVKQGTGTLSLNTANTYSGGTIISAGTLIGNNADSLGGRAITLGNSASGTDTVTLQFANGVTVTNAITVTTNGGLATIGVGTYSGPIVINKDLQTPNPGLSSGDFSSYGGITGTGNLIVAASGGWRTRLGNAGSGGGIANTFTGNVYVASGGVLNMGGGYSVTKNLLPDTAMLSVTGSVEMTVGVVNEVIDTLTGNGTFDVGSGGTLTVGYNNGTGTYTGTLSGLGGLTKIGTGKQTLSGNNISYTGNTVISNGTLIVTTNMAGNSTLYIYSGATLEARDYGLKTNKTINFNYANNVMGAFVVTNNLNLNSNVIIQINGSGTLPSPLVLFTYNTISGVTNNFDSWTIRGVYNMVPVIDTANKRVVLRVDNDGWKIPLEQPKNLQRNKLMKIRR